MHVVLHHRFLHCNRRREGIIGLLGEQGHDAVPDVLVDEPSGGPDLRSHPAQERVQEIEVLDGVMVSERAVKPTMSEKSTAISFSVWSPSFTSRMLPFFEQPEELLGHELAVALSSASR